MFSIIAYTGVIILAASPFIPVKMSYHKRLSVIFRRTNFMRELRNYKGDLQPKQPRYLGETKTDSYVEHAYSIPLGHVLSESLEKAIVEAFDVPVKVYAEGGRLYVRFYSVKLPKSVRYDDVPVCDNSHVIPVGLSLDGWVFHDFDRTPHMTVAGATRQGKTVFLKNAITYLCENNEVNDVRLYLIDLKGGLEFGRYERLRQTVGVASNVEQTADILNDIQTEMSRRMAYFKREGHTNIVDSPIKQRTFVIVDEAAQLTPEPYMPKETRDLLAYCQHVLSEITRIGGALGYRLIFATQYPTGDTLPRQIKQNADAKIAFRLPTELASRVAIDEQGAESLPQPGRAIYRTVDRTEIQVPYISDGESERRLAKYKTADITWNFDEGGGNGTNGRIPSEEISRTDDDDIIEFG